MRVTSPAVTQLRQLQQSLYEKAYKEAHDIVAGASLAILSYSAKFEKSLPKTFTTSTLTSVIEELRKKQFVLYGDFHTQRQSQRGLLRLLRSYTERMRSNKVVIALEMFKARDQDFIDAYLAGRLPEDEFLDSVNYQTEWGFPWPNFKMILDFAKARKLPVIGVNTDNGGRDSLAARDRFAAARLCDAAAKYPAHKIVCLIGEYHLADTHLPAALNRELKRRGRKLSTLRLVNNIDRYYFQMPREAHNTTEYLKLKKDFFCIMNSPPWMKWQSFSMWEEMRSGGGPQVAAPEADMDSDLDLQTEDAYDVDYQFFQFVKNLAGFLGLKIDSSDLESFHIYFSQDSDFFPGIEAHTALTPAEAERLFERASTDGVYFITRSNTVLLSHISINNLAEAAGQYLHSLLTGFDDTTGKQADDFLRRILKSAVGMVASKILNPRRKCMELHHHRQLLRRSKGRRLTGAAHDKRNTANAVLKFDKWMQGRLAAAPLDVTADFPTVPAAPAAPRGVLIQDRRANYEISREIGQMLGFSLYKKIIAGKAPATRMRRLFKRKLPTAHAVWEEIAALYQLMNG